MAAKQKAQSPLTVGNKVMIRTVTLYYTGRIVGLSKEEVLIDDAAWIADTGRFSAALSSGALNEVEPFPGGVVSVSRGAIIDVSFWAFDLPRMVK